MFPRMEFPLPHVPMASRSEPLSIETLLRKQREEKEAASKVRFCLSVQLFYLTPLQPKFLSKEERAKLALDKREQEIREQREKDEKRKVERDALERDAEELRQKEFQASSSKYSRCQCSSFDVAHAHTLPDEDRYAHPERDRGDRHGRRDRDSRRPPASRDGFQNVPTAPRADREKQPPTPTPASEAAPFVPPMTENDLSAIRSRYLGVDKKKRKIRKMNDRKFVFDWDAQDDTYSEDSPVAVGSNRQGAQIMFGRGHIAGMDDGGRKGSGPHDTHLADAMERRRAAKAGFDDRHWTEKPLNEMTERDWRIFREDFSISARGRCMLPSPRPY